MEPFTPPGNNRSRQHHAFELFTALKLLQPSWAGTLLLGLRLDDAGRALALASLAAGAAALFLEPDPAQVRGAQREGCCTFTVTTLDEALRTLKNEIRQGRAITVALGGNHSAWLNEIVERGVQPAFLAGCDSTGNATTATEVLRTRGARGLRGFGLTGTADDVDLQQLVTAASDGCSVAEDIAPTLLERRAQDTHLLASLHGEDPHTELSCQWLHAAPTLFPKSLERTFWKERSMW